LWTAPSGPTTKEPQTGTACTATKKNRDRGLKKWQKQEGKAKKERKQGWSTFPMKQMVGIALATKKTASSK